MKSDKRMESLKRAGVAVCDGKCAGCRRGLCTGARAIAEAKRK